MDQPWSLQLLLQRHAKDLCAEFGSSTAAEEDSRVFWIVPLKTGASMVGVSPSVHFTAFLSTLPRPCLESCSDERVSRQFGVVLKLIG